MKRNDNWFNGKNFILLPVKIYNDPNNPMFQSILRKIETVRWHNPDITKTKVLLEALSLWADIETTVDENPLVQPIQELTATVEELKRQIGQLKTQGVNVTQLEQSTASLTNHPLMKKIIGRHEEENG